MNANDYYCLKYNKNWREQRWQSVWFLTGKLVISLLRSQLARQLVILQDKKFFLAGSPIFVCLFIIIGGRSRKLFLKPQKIINRLLLTFIINKYVEFILIIVCFTIFSKKIFCDMISLNTLTSQYLSLENQIIISAKSLFFLLTFWLYSLGIQLAQGTRPNV